MVPDSLFENSNPPCRLERINSNKFDAIGLSVVLDVCHNPQGVEEVLNELIQELDQNEEIVIMMGSSKGKNVEGIFQAMAEKSQNKIR